MRFLSTLHELTDTTINAADHMYKSRYLVTSLISGPLRPTSVSSVLFFCTFLLNHSI